MSALTMSGDFGHEKPVDRNSTTSQPVAEVVAEPAKEKSMEKAATLPAAAAGTPLGERLRELHGQRRLSDDEHLHGWTMQAVQRRAVRWQR